MNDDRIAPMKRSEIKEQIVQAWSVIEALIEAGAEPQSPGALAKACNLTYSKTRRILITWERLGLVERKGNNWTYTKYLTIDIPKRLQAQAAETYRKFEIEHRSAIG